MNYNLYYFRKNVTLVKKCKFVKHSIRAICAFTKLWRRETYYADKMLHDLRILFSRFTGIFHPIFLIQYLLNLY